MGKNVLDFEVIESLTAGDWFPFVRSTESDDTKKDSIIEKTNIDSYVDGRISSSVKTYTLKTINNGNTDSMPLGSITNYHGFSVKALIGIGTDRYVLNMDFDYHGATTNAYLINASRRLPTGLNVIQSSDVAGQFNWKVTNNTGSTVTIYYRVTEQINAI